MRLESPHGGVGRTQVGHLRLTAATLGEVLWPRFILPSRILTVMLGHPPIKFPRNTADGRFVADVRRPQSPSGQSSQEASRLGDDDTLAQARRLHCRGDAAGSRAEDAHVRFDELGARHRTQSESETPAKPTRDRFHGERQNGAPAKDSEARNAAGNQ